MSIATILLDLARKVAAATVPGAPEAIVAGTSLLDLVAAISPTLSEDDQRKLQEDLPALLVGMMRAVDQAVEDLGGASS